MLSIVLKPISTINKAATTTTTTTPTTTTAGDVIVDVQLAADN